LGSASGSGSVPPLLEAKAKEGDADAEEESDLTRLPLPYLVALDPAAEPVLKSDLKSEP
jgi:hypothetical protein